MIAIVDYGSGNLSSIQNMCRRLDIAAVISSDPAMIEQADKLILPGVGHFKTGMESLQNSGLKPLLDELVLVKKKPVLGICLGAQLMTKHSEEGNIAGLGWIEAVTVRFDQSKDQAMKVPHMGWSNIKTNALNPLWTNLPANPRFYFVHSYHFLFADNTEVSATCHHSYEFACAFHKNNIFGTQFHPEKSHRFGMKILENFNKL